MAAATLLTLTGCQSGVGGGDGATTVRASTTRDTAPPPVPTPGAAGNCPYLSNAVAADKNGQQVGRVRLSEGTPPACFFYRPNGELQLQTMVFQTSPKAAEAVVDRAAPIATSSKWQVLDWQGGTQKTGKDTTVAISKEGNAVVVITNQRTINATEVAEHVIKTLGL